MKRKFIGTLSLRVHYLEQGERVERLCLLDTICTGWPKLMQYFYSYMAGEHFFSLWRPIRKERRTSSTDSSVGNRE